MDDSLRLMKYVKKKQSSEFEETPEFQVFNNHKTKNNHEWLMYLPLHFMFSFSFLFVTCQG